MLPTNLLIFNHPGKPHFIPHWREDINMVAYEHRRIFEQAGIEMDIFNNSSPDGTKLIRYPRIQYRVYNGQLALWGIGPGATALHLLAGLLHGQILCMMPGSAPIAKTGQPQLYRMYHWLALDKKNYDAYNARPDFGKRITLLQDILREQLRFFLSQVAPLKGNPHRKLVIREITQVMDGQQVRFHNKEGSAVNKRMKAFNLTFSVPLALPYEMALGNKVSLGFGRIQPLPCHKGQSVQAGSENDTEA